MKTKTARIRDIEFEAKRTVMEEESFKRVVLANPAPSTASAVDCHKSARNIGNHTEWAVPRLKRLDDKRSTETETDDKPPDGSNDDPSSLARGARFRGPSSRALGPSQQQHGMDRNHKRPKRRSDVPNINEKPLNITCETGPKRVPRKVIGR